MAERLTPKTKREALLAQQAFIDGGLAHGAGMSFSCPRAMNSYPIPTKTITRPREATWNFLTLRVSSAGLLEAKGRTVDGQIGWRNYPGEQRWINNVVTPAFFALIRGLYEAPTETVEVEVEDGA